MNVRIAGPATTYLTDRIAAVMDVFDPGVPKSRNKETVVKASGLLLGNQAAVDATKWNISKALSLAEQAQSNRTINKVYLEVDTGNGVWKRSEITGGELRIATEHYDRLKRDFVPYELYINRKPYWEGAEAAIPLSNLNGSNNTTGLNVYNANDLAGSSPNRRCNYADIASGVIAGDMPAPLKLTGKNLFAAYGNNNDNLGVVWIGMGYTNPTTIKHVIEAESTQTGIGVSGSSVSSSACSAGAYWSFAMHPSSLNTYYTVGAYALSTANLSAFAGQRIRVLPRAAWASGFYSIFQFRLRVNNFSWQSDWVSPDAGYARSIQSLFDVRMPPLLEGLSSLGPATVYLDVRNTSANTITLGLDDILLFPTDGWCEFSSNIPTNSQFVVDGTEDRYYGSDSNGVNRFALREFISNGLEVQPGKAHRLFIAQHTIYGNQWLIGQVISLKASYRPRWGTL